MPGKPIVSNHSAFPGSFHANVIWIAETVNKGFYCWPDSSNDMLFICIYGLGLSPKSPCVGGLVFGLHFQC